MTPVIQVPVPGAGAGVPADATGATKGILQLAGDLGPPAAAPTVPGLTLKADKLPITRPYTADATLALLDADNVVRVNSASLVTLTVPLAATVNFGTNTVIEIYCAGTGGVTLVGAAGVTLRPTTVTIYQFDTISLRKDASDEWVVSVISGGSAAPGSASMVWVTDAPYNADPAGAIDSSDAIINADTAAATKGVPLFFPPGTYKYTKSLTMSAAWRGVPRKSILSKTSAFTFTVFGGGPAQFSIVNKNFGLTYNAATADNVDMRDLDVTVTMAAGGKTGLGLANVAGGTIRNVKFTTTGATGVDSLLDLYACVRNLVVEDVDALNTTGATNGGACWIRNLTTAGATAANDTQGVRIVRGHFATGTADEAMSIFGWFGKVRDVKVDGTVFEGLPTATLHNALFSVFPGSNAGANVNAMVENITVDNCTFYDLNETVRFYVIRIGLSTDANKVQDIQIKSPSIYARTAQVVGSGAIVIKDEVTDNAWDGKFSGIEVTDAYINTTGSSQVWDAAIQARKVLTPTITGNKHKYGVQWSRYVEGGEIEAVTSAWYNCKVVQGGYAEITDTATGALMKWDANFGDCQIAGVRGNGGREAVLVTAGVPSGVTIKVSDFTHASTAATGNWVNQSGSSRVLVTDGMVKVSTSPAGGAALTTFGSSILHNNDIYGTWTA
jgi:hypothetical protein